MPCGIRDDANRQPICALGASEAVEHVEIAIVQVAARLVEQAIEERRLARDVHVAPTHEVGSGTVLDDHAIHGGAPGRLTRLDDEGAVCRQDALTSREGSGDQLGGREVAVYFAVSGKAKLGQLRKDAILGKGSCRHM